MTVTKIKTIRFELLMDAGNGAQKAGDILIKALAKTGRYVFIEPLIPAEISPPKRTPFSLSGVVIRSSGEPVKNIGSYTDFAIVEHEILLNRRLDDDEFSKNSTVLLDLAFIKRAEQDYQEAILRAKEKNIDVIGFHMTETAQGLIKELNGNGKNMYYLGLLTAHFSLEYDIVETIIKETFKKLKPEILDKNLIIFKEGFDHKSDIFSEQIEIPSEPSSEEHVLLDGNLALALGSIDAGFKLYAGYPITPASSIMHHLAQLFPQYGGTLHQAEDEISAIGTVVGSYYAGVPSLTATSGPGLSLKQEIIGLSAVAEIPLVVINVQRGGPSTGLPTRTEQSDLFASIFGSHGDATRVVISVGDVEDCFYAPHMARYFTEKLRVPVMIMSDYITSVSYKILPKLELAELESVDDLPQTVFDHYYVNPLPDTIEMVKENQSTPGDPGKMRRITGLNTDVNGKVSYTSASSQRSHEVRNEKLHHVRRALKTPEIIGDTSGDLLLVAWGSSKGVLDEAICLAREEGLSVSGMHLKIVYPLPLMLGDVFKSFKRIITVETCYADSLKATPFATLLRSETLTNIENGISNAHGRPLKPEEVLSKIKEILC